MVNAGYWGMAVTKDDAYRLALLARGEGMLTATHREQRRQRDVRESSSSGHSAAPGNRWMLNSQPAEPTRKRGW